MKYRGYVYDNETGLYYLQSRYYDPETGRFLNADDVDYLGASGTMLGYNSFAYCENNPINGADHFGNQFNEFLKNLASFIDGLSNLFVDKLVSYEPGPLTGICFVYGSQIYNYTSEFYGGDDYVYDSSATPSIKNLLMGALWYNAALSIAPLYPDGYKFYAHYRNGKGADLIYDYSKAINEDKAIKNYIENLKMDLKYCVERAGLKSGKKYIISSILDSTVGTTPETLNWKLAIGTHIVAIIAEIQNNNDVYYVKAVIIAFDRYNFSKGDKFANLIPGDWNGELVSIGKAYNYTSYGFAQISFYWS